ncbi:MAG: hypothetical protein AAF512_11830 [Pseudomonadota bacterium]
MKPWLPESIQSMNIVQKGLWETLRQASGGASSEEADAEEKPARTRKPARTSRRRPSSSD